jgi:hypothetical protein
MKSIFNFIIKPKKNRYNNIKKISDKELIINTEISEYQNISKEGIVIGLPSMFETDININDEVIIHHNVFRRWYDIRGVEQNSRSWFDEDTYIVSIDQIYAFKKDNKWKPLSGYCFVKPVKATNKVAANEKEKPLIGIIKYIDDTLTSIGLRENDLVGFTPKSEFEFVIDEEKLYRIKTEDISIKYEYQGNEKEYNPSWL